MCLYGTPREGPTCRVSSNSRCILLPPRKNMLYRLTRANSSEWAWAVNILKEDQYLMAASCPRGAFIMRSWQRWESSLSSSWALWCSEGRASSVKMRHHGRGYARIRGNSISPCGLAMSDSRYPECSECERFLDMNSPTVLAHLCC